MTTEAYTYKVVHSSIHISDEENELLCLVDANDRVIGSIARSDSVRLSPQGDKFLRAASAFVQRSDGKLWVPTRSQHKKIAPGGIDYSAGGHVAVGENYLDTIVRELYEEAQLTVTPAECTLIGRHTPGGDSSYYFDQLYLVRSDAPLILSDEHADGNWYTLEEVLQLVVTGTRCKVSYLRDVTELRQYLEKN